MKKIYFLTALILLTTTSIIAQKELHNQGHKKTKPGTEKDHIKSNALKKTFVSGQNKDTKETKEDHTVVYYNFTSETDSSLSKKTIDKFDDNGYYTLASRYYWSSKDSTWKGNTKQKWEYDAEGNMVLQTYYNDWDSEKQAWIGYHKYTYTRNTNNKISSLIDYNWDKENIRWIKNVKEEFEYDNKGDDSSKIDYDWNSENQEWIKSSEYKYNYEYNDSGKDTLKIEYKLENGEWIKNSKEESSYNAGGKRIIWARYNWDSKDGSWVGDTKNKYDFDANGNTILDVDYNWDTTNNAWIRDYKRTKEFDAEGNKTLSVSYNEWDTTNNTWIGRDKTKWEYDAEGNDTLKIRYNWARFSSDTWNRSSKYKYEYNDEGKKILEYYYNWEANNDKWIRHRKSEYKYDSEGKRRLYIEFNWEDDVWVLDSKGFYDYSDGDDDSQTGIIDKDASGKINIYPNPAKENVNISAKSKINKIVIYDMNGSMIKNRTVSNMKPQISTAELNSGIYVLRIFTEKGIYNKKLQIQQ